MKLTYLLFFMTILNVFGSNTYAQHKKLNLNMQDVSIQTVLGAIEDQSEFFFLYSSKMIDVAKKVDIYAESKNITDVLDGLFANSDIKYDVKDRQILLINKDADTDRRSQQNNVTGTVTDDKNNPLAGVSIVVKGSTVGALTDISGKYAISNVPQNATLVFSFVGLASQEFPVSGRNQIDVVLTEAAIGLNEVVVTGYSTQRKKDITGSVAIADVASLKKMVATSAQNALQGLASGVNVINSGVPGSAAKILIRGVTSFGNTDPLVIVDGLAASLNQVNASEVESIQVLKDAGSAAIYGVRGANGVIIVTTKKGKAGKPVITYEGSYGITFPLTNNPYNMLSSEDWFTIFGKLYPGSELMKFGGAIPDYSFRGPAGAGAGMAGAAAVDPSLYYQDLKNIGKNYIIQKLNKTNNGGDWWDWTFNKAATQMHTLSASGGTENAKYLFGLGYIDQEGTMVSSFLKRYNARINTEFTPNKYIRIGENINVLHQSNNSPGDGGATSAWRMCPLVPLYDIAGNWGGSYGGPDLSVNSNQVALANRDIANDSNYAWYIIGNAYAEADFLKNFTARSSLGFNTYNTFNHNFTANQPENIEQATADNSLTVSATYGSTMTWTNTLIFKQTIGKHDVKLLIGSEAIKYVYRSDAGTSANFFSPDELFQVLGNGTQNISVSSGVSKTGLFSVFSRLDYAYDGKYLLGATLRRDGSSVFGAEKRYGIFPSVSLGWRISQESFMQNLTWMNDLKIRASYGILGSQNNVSASNAFSLYGSGLGTTYYDISGANTSVTQGFSRSRIGNPYTGWEENIISNIGFDASLLKNRLEISVEYYKKSINGLLFTQPLPAVIIGGATAPTINIGDIKNTGIDGSVRLNGNITTDLHYSVGLNVTSYKNMVVNIPDPGYFDAGSMQAMGSICRNQEGHPVSSFFGYQIVGLFNSDNDVAASPTQNGAAPGRFKYQDTNSDGAITAADRVHLGDPNPDITYGLNLRLDYKGFDFTAIFYGSQGNELCNGVYNYTGFFSNYQEAKSNRLLDAWTPENTNTTQPKNEITHSFSTDQTMNSYYVEDGSYFRLRSLVLGYTLKPSVLKRIGISQFRVYGQAANLFTITKYSGVDPEIGGSASSFGIDTGKYPDNEPGLIFGVNVTF